MYALLTMLRVWLSGHRADLRLAVRIVVAGLATFALAHLFDLAQGFWAVITAMIVMQASVGGSLKAAIDRLLGTVAGAVFGGVVDFLVPHAGFAELAIALVVALAPLALLASLYPSFRIAPVTAIIVLLTPTASTFTPLELTVDRIAEIGLGCVIGLAVALLVFPARAHGLIAEGAAHILDLLAELLPMALAGLEKPLDAQAVLGLQARIRGALARLEGLAGEARGERAGHLTDEPDPAPLVRTAMRLRHDLVMLIRAADAPMPAAIHARLSAALGRVADAGTALLKACANALRARRKPPGLDVFYEALENYSGEIASLRREGRIRELPGDVVGRLFAVGFGLEQMRQDFADLEKRVVEFSNAEGSPVITVPQS